LYVSVKNLSRIIKVDRKTGKLLASYGEKYPSGQAKFANGFFNYMHAPSLLPDGNILVFNNNNHEKSLKSRKASSVVVFSEPKSEKDNSEKIWEFSCKFDSLYDPYSVRTGNAIYLNNNDVLVNMGDPVSRIFEVTRNKKIVWDCYSEKYSEEKKCWLPSCNFKISYAGSLYPVYFTTSDYFNPDTLKFKNNLKYNFKINNEGSDPDRYIVKYYLNSALIKTYCTDFVLPGKSTNAEIIFKKENINHKKVNISVYSFADPGFKRELNFYID
jgi:hypothetical protein